MPSMTFAGASASTVRSQSVFPSPRSLSRNAFMRTRVPLSPLAAALIVLICTHASVASAPTPLIPYSGKNNVHYDRFEWNIYTTDHFEIYYYPALEAHLERIAGYAESAYQQISADLKHDLSFKVQLILFKTHSEFEQENIDP